LILKTEEKKNKNIFKNIFKDNWEKFKELNPEYNIDQYNNVVKKMLECGSEAGGYVEYRCFNCGMDSRRIAFSCKSMFCLSCTKVYIDNFVNKISNMLHPGMRYRHVVLTIPEQLRVYFYRDRTEGDILKELFKTGYKCLEDVMERKFRKKLKIGAIMVLQTYGRSGRYVPHLHVIMTNGGFWEDKSIWKELGYIPYKILHEEWQKHLLEMIGKEIKTAKMEKLIKKLKLKYPKGFVVDISKGEAPSKESGLARYLAKYVASPPISVRRIIEYTGDKVKYCYKDHKTKKMKEETVDVMTFIGRMIQHVLPKGFQRVKYYGIQASKTLKTWREKIKNCVKGLKRKIKDVYEVIEKVNYRERYKKGCGKDPFICSYCGAEMDLSIIWHPDYGVIYNELERIKKGYYEKREKGRYSVRTTSKNVQLSMFEM
jgi:hypothetical protein